MQTQGYLKEPSLSSTLSEHPLMQTAKFASSVDMLRLYNVLKSLSSLTTYKALLHFFGKFCKRFFHDATALCGTGPPHYGRFTITFRHTTLVRTARLRDYLTTHNIHNRETSMPPAGFEPAIPASERPQDHALDRAATGIGCKVFTRQKS